MHRSFKKLCIVILGLTCLGGCMFGPTKEQMNAELKKPEVIAVIEESIKNIDKNAFTDTGVIKSYAINYDTVKHNPMGGISVTVYINNNTDMDYQMLISKDLASEKYTISGSISESLSNLMKVVK